jgi:hypothetical protein
MFAVVDESDREKWWVSRCEITGQVILSMPWIEALMAADGKN